MFESVATDLQAHLSLWGLNQQVYLLHFHQTHRYVSMFIPNQRAGKHSCTRTSGMYVTFHLTSCHVFIFCLLSACMSIKISSYRHPCKLYSHPTINHVCNNCTYEDVCLIHLHRTISYFYSNIQPSVLSVALAPD